MRLPEPRYVIRYALKREPSISDLQCHGQDSSAPKIMIFRNI